MSKIRKVIIALFFCPAVLWVIAFVWIQLYYYSNLPKTPDEPTGRIYRIAVNHGSIRYGSKREIQISRTVEDFQPIAIIFALIGGAIGLRYGDFKVRDDSHNRLP
jgi:hypothetical protein